MFNKTIYCRFTHIWQSQNVVEELCQGSELHAQAEHPTDQACICYFFLLHQKFFSDFVHDLRINIRSTPSLHHHTHLQLLINQLLPQIPHLFPQVLVLDFELDVVVGRVGCGGLVDGDLGDHRQGQLRADLVFEGFQFTLDLLVPDLCLLFFEFEAPHLLPQPLILLPQHTIPLHPQLNIHIIMIHPFKLLPQNLHQHLQLPLILPHQLPQPLRNLTHHLFILHLTHLPPNINLEFRGIVLGLCRITYLLVCDNFWWAGHDVDYSLFEKNLAEFIAVLEGDFIVFAELLLEFQVGFVGLGQGVGQLPDLLLFQFGVVGQGLDLDEVGLLFFNHLLMCSLQRSKLARKQFEVGLRHETYGLFRVEVVNVAKLFGDFRVAEERLVGGWELLLEVGEFGEEAVQAREFPGKGLLEGGWEVGGAHIQIFNYKGACGYGLEGYVNQFLCYLLKLFFPDQFIISKFQMQSVIESIDSPSDYTDTLAALTASILDESQKNTRKAQTNKLLQAIFNLITDPQTDTQTKFYSIMICKDLASKKYPTFLSCLANSPLLLQMSQLCRTIDPDKKQKHYGHDKLTGGKFITLVSECITKWAEKHPLTTNRTPSRFKVEYAELIADGVVMPKEFMYFSQERRDSNVERNLVAESNRNMMMMEGIGGKGLGFESQDSVIDSEKKENIGVRLSVMKEKRPSNLRRLSDQRKMSNQYGLDGLGMGLAEFSIKEKEEPVTLGAGLGLSEVKENTNALDKFLSVNKAAAGFNSVRMQLERQKSTGRHKSTSSKRKPPKQRSADASRFASTTVNNQNTLIIPNAKVDRTDYLGQVTPMRLSYLNDLRQLNSGQTLDRFKKSLIKNKNVIYQDSTIQVGYKSQFIFQPDPSQDQPFQVFINFTLYFGNKTPQPITDLKAIYRGDKSNILYCSPQRIAPSIPPASQTKQQLLVAPNDIPCGLIRCTFQYLSGQLRTCRFLLPNTILKLSTLFPLNPSQFEEEFNKCKQHGKIYRSPIFKLSKVFQAKNLTRYMPELCELTSFEDFLAQREKEYELGCGGNILESDEFLIKVRVRADATCVIQMATLDEEGGGGEEETERNVGNYLQAMQFMLGSEIM